MEEDFRTPFLTCKNCNALNVLEGNAFNHIPECVHCGKGLHLRLGVRDVDSMLTHIVARRQRQERAAVLIQSAVRRWQAYRLLSKLRWVERYAACMHAVHPRCVQRCLQ